MSNSGLSLGLGVYGLGLCLAKYGFQSINQSSLTCSNHCLPVPIIAYLLYLVSFLLQVIQKAGEDLKVSNKIIGIILFILLIIGGALLSRVCNDETWR